MAVFGIHLGDYQAVLAVYKNGRTDILANEAGERETSMIVTYKDDSVIVGTSAKRSLHRNLQYTAHSMPSLVTGIAECEHVQKIIQSSYCKIIVNDNSQICYEFDQSQTAKPTKKPLHVTPQDSLIRILKELFTTAKAFQPSSLIKCVLSVPISYTEDQTSTLKKCVESVGFSVLSTPISPALSLLPYGIDRDSFSGHVLVFDMGLRTLTLTIIKCINSLMTVVNSSTTYEVGGAYLDNLLVSVLREECKRTFLKDLSNNERVTLKLLAAAETVKHSLSIQQTAAVYIESLYDGMDFQCSITRGRFEGACHHVFQSIQEPLEAVLTSAKLSPSEIDKVVLVGGVCKIQYLQQLLREWLPSSEILSSVSPEHVVAMGGAIQGDYHIRYLESIGNVPCSMSCTSQDIWIHCTDCVDPVSVVLLREHTPLPAQNKVMINVEPKELDKNVSIDVREGEREHEVAITKIEVPLLSDANYLQLEIELKWKDSDIVLIVKDIASDWKYETSLLARR